jgi:NCS2 family nucleobase:cation symporter-2
MAEGDEPIYNVRDNVPFGTTVLTILQHFFVLAVYMTYPVIISDAIGGSTDLTMFLISATLIGSGIATILQSFSKTGAGYLLPIVPNSSYLPASLLAATAGGLPLLYGMLIISGFFEMAISRFTKFFRIVFPNEVTGVVLFLLGIAIVPFAFPLFFGSTDSGPLDPASAVVGVITLSATILLSVIPRRFFKFYAILIGIVIGMAASVLLGVFKLKTLLQITSLSVFWIPNPIGIVSYSFEFALLIPFAIAMICVMLKSVGNISLLNAYTKAGEKNTLKNGLLSEGAGVAITGALGGIGIGSSSGATGLVVGTGIAAKKVGLGLGIFLILCGFLPAIGWVFHILPKPILGATLLYAVTFVMVTGIQSIASRMLDPRRKFVVILPILIGVSSAVCPYLYADLPKTLALFFASPLTSGSMAVLVLGLLLKIGIRKHRSFDFSKDTNLQRFLFECGRQWTLDKMQVLSIANHLQNLADAGKPERLEIAFEPIGMLRAEMVFKEPVESVPKMKINGNLEVEGRVVKASYPLM